MIRSILTAPDIMPGIRLRKGGALPGYVLFLSILCAPSSASLLLVFHKYSASIRGVRKEEE